MWIMPSSPAETRREGVPPFASGGKNARALTSAQCLSRLLP